MRNPQQMALKIYNTLTKRKEPFKPITPGQVQMYVCGPTVYDSCHIGHARSVIVFDVIARYFRARGFEVRYVRNFTDIDDKIINRASQLNLSPSDIARKYIDEFYTDMDALNVERATVEPRATEYVDQIITFVTLLIDKGFAYAIDGDVYFAVEKSSAYGKLSGRKLEEMEAGARVAVDRRKSNPHDFALWKNAKPGEPSWDSPWGKGRPGWHIECSAMGSDLLGETFDIHGGGKDLIFPHHENEIAQSEAAFGKPFANYWIHNGFVNIDHEKMSKSLGNFLMVKDVLKTYHPEVVRLFLLSNHYRSPIDFNDQALSESSRALERIYQLMARLEERGRHHETDAVGDTWRSVCEAMDDDFNTARAIGIIFEAVHKANRLMDGQGDDHRREIDRIWGDLKKTGAVLGIMSQAPETYFVQQQERLLQDKAIDPQMVDQLVMDRMEARLNKDWEKADCIRSRLDQMGVVVEDRPDGSVWKMK
jgi:cysteinyl-tRNA synthetase